MWHGLGSNLVLGRTPILNWSLLLALYTLLAELYCFVAQDTMQLDLARNGSHGYNASPCLTAVILHPWKVLSCLDVVIEHL